MKRLLFIFALMLGLSASGQDIINSFIWEAGCTADPNEQLTDANAAADAYCNEANATTGFGTNGGGGTLTSDSDSSVGDYAIKLDTPANTVGYIIEVISVTAGDQFTVSWDAKEAGTGADGRATAWTNVVSAVNEFFTTSYATYSVNIEASATGTIQMRFYASPGGGQGNARQVFLDNLSVKKTN